MKKRIIALLAALVFAAALILPLAGRVSAKALDEILLYEITAEVNGDATVTLTYHISWKVLDDKTDGPLEWVKIGIPNDRYVSMRSLSPAAETVRYYEDGGYYARIDLDRKYYANEVVDFSFEVVADYLYQMNLYNEGETVYEFIPGWFDETDVDKLIVRWKAEKAIGHSPAAPLESDGFFTWERALPAGERMQISVTYPNDAFVFSEEKQIIDEDNYERSGSADRLGSVFAGLIGFAVFCFVGIAVIGAIVNAIGSYKGSSGFTTTTKKKITKTKVKYYPTCQGCGAPRPEGAENCEYCGRSFIESEETVTEEEIPEEVKGKDTDGLYHYGSSPNTFLRVHVVPVVVRTPNRTSSYRSSCAHSSCACASSCASACACACAGGGRAGCSTKDFYNTGLKLTQLELKKKKRK